MPNADLPPEERLSWLVEMCPFLEQDALFKRFDLTRGCNAAENREAANTAVRTYLCPAGLSGDSLPAQTHYVGIAGVGPDAALLPASDARAGAFGHQRRLTFKDVTDGTSQTLLAVETESDVGPWAAGGTASVRGVDPEAAPCVGRGRAFGRLHNQDAFAVSPPALANVVLLDGSVRFLSDAVSAKTFEALATIAGGDTVGSDY